MRCSTSPILTPNACASSPLRARPQRHNLSKELARITVPVLLVWGLNDTITPPVVAHEFARLLPQAELCFLDHCGHAPMMERPAGFNRYLGRFLSRTEPAPAVLA